MAAAPAKKFVVTEAKRNANLEPISIIWDWCCRLQARPHCRSSNMTKRTTRLRQLLDDPKILVAPGTYDGTGARLVQALGFEAAYMSGFETSASLLGQPDVGYLTATEMTERVAALCDIIDLPLIADGDTGYGNPLNVRRMIRDYERAGAAAVHIEDQTSPKRCGHMLGRDVIPLGEMVQKI
jgi:2,3-dimethylmalate lyase